MVKGFFILQGEVFSKPIVSFSEPWFGGKKPCTI
jgi:hypothetical protein